MYKTTQVKIRYVVKFCLAEDQIKQFQPGTGVEIEQDNTEPESQCHLQNESKKCFLFVYWLAASIIYISQLLLEFLHAANLLKNNL